MLVNLKIDLSEYYYSRDLKSIIRDKNWWDEIKNIRLGDEVKILQNGIYEYRNVNSKELVNKSNNKLISDDPWGDYKLPYGICDNYEQVLKEYTNFINVPDRNFVIIMCKINNLFIPNNGFIWENWGEYIGKHKISGSYLSDSPEIELVYVYHIYEIL